MLASVKAVQEVSASVRSTVDNAGRSWRVSEAGLIQEAGLNPTVFKRIEALIPSSARYDLVIAPRLSSTAPAQAFAYLLAWHLLPRIEVASGSATWQIVWGARKPDCCRVWSVGQVEAGEPPVMVVLHA